MAKMESALPKLRAEESYKPLNPQLHPPHIVPTLALSVQLKTLAQLVLLEPS